ncbi:MAG TPA: ADYC domain-containing protein [Kofleriaceae bacterium]
MYRAAVASLVLSGCAFDDHEEPTASQTSQHSEINNGISLNGISLNGISLNGISLNGISLNGISLNGISLNGISLNGISLNGISLNGTSLAEVVGSTWTAGLSNGGEVALRIDSATQGTGSNSDVGMYGISIAGDNGWQPLCGLDGGAPILAIAVPGTWNLATATYSGSSTQQTFACRGKTVAKCVEMGYKPWSGHADYLAACTRLLRGDYCGDGHAYTVDGTTLNIYDNLGLQADTESWLSEGEWTPNGARCVSSEGAPRYLLTPGNVPSCVSAGTVPTTSNCGDSFASGALLVSELPD